MAPRGQIKPYMNFYWIGDGRVAAILRHLYMRKARVASEATGAGDCGCCDALNWPASAMVSSAVWSNTYLT